MPSKKEITGIRKAAALLIALGPDVSAQVMKQLSEEEIEQITLEIANLGRIEPDTRDKVIEEFYQMALAQDYITQGGLEYARQVLEKALGAQKAIEILERLTATLQITPFEFMRKMDAKQILSFIQDEHPQTIALILSYLTPDQAAAILSSLPPELMTEISMRMAKIDRTSPDVVHKVESILERKLALLTTQESTNAGGIKHFVEILNRVDRNTEKTVIEYLEGEDPELAEEVKRQMFLFEDIVILDDRSIQRVLREIDSKDLALALKGAGEEVKQKIFKNMSARASQMLKEDMEFMGPVRVRDVEQAQQRIVSVIRRLDETGEIVVSRGGEEELIV
ncbi:MAG: flagellar motor switch protein FliG [bacterium]